MAQHRTILLRWSKPARLGAGLLSLVLAVVAGAVVADWLEPLDLTRLKQASVVVEAQDGRILRAFKTPDHQWRLLLKLMHRGICSFIYDSCYIFGKLVEIIALLR